MKKILIYGDSNVWGDNFITGMRIPEQNQWANKLQYKLGSEYKILQEGLPGRLAGSNEETKKYKNGKDTFISTFRTNAPVDTLVIALGTNDLQLKYNKLSEEIISDLIWYKDIVYESYLDEEDKKKYFKDGKMPNIIYIMPINFDYKINAKEIFDYNCEIKRQEIIKYFKDNSYNLVVLNDAALFDDGIHLNYDGHEQMTDAVWEVVKDEQDI